TSRLFLALSSTHFHHFPRHIFSAFVFTQAKEDRMAQAAVARPFGEADLRDEFRLQPGAEFHLGCRDALAKSAAALRGQVHEGTRRAAQRFELVEQLTQPRLRVAAADL